MKLLGKFWRRNETCVTMLWIKLPDWTTCTMLQIKQLTYLQLKCSQTNCYHQTAMQYQHINNQNEFIKQRVQSWVEKRSLHTGLLMPLRTSAKECIDLHLR